MKKAITSISIIFLSIFLLGFSNNLTAQLDSNDFVFTIKTDNPGTLSNDSSYYIFGNGLNYDVDWDNDGIFDSIGVTTDISHQYPNAGTYTIRIRGTFFSVSLGKSIFAADSFDSQKLISIDQWGNQAWKNMLFAGCSNMNILATDAPILDSINFFFTFMDCTSLNADLSNWNVSSVNDLSYLFRGASNFNQNLGSWNIDSVSFMNGMLDSTGLSIANYDSTLIGWQSKPHLDSVTLGVYGLKYCLGEAARDSLIADGWTFVGDSKDTNCIITHISETEVKTASRANLVVYPNPTSGVLNLEIKDLELNQPLFIYNHIGQLIKETRLVNGRNQVDLVGQAKGVYFVRYGQSSKKIVLLE